MSSKWFCRLQIRKEKNNNTNYKNKNDTVDRTSLNKQRWPHRPHYHLRSGSENFSFVIPLPTPFPYHDHLQINIHLSFSRRNNYRLENFSLEMNFLPSIFIIFFLNLILEFESLSLYIIIISINGIQFFKFLFVFLCKWFFL